MLTAIRVLAETAEAADEDDLPELLKLLVERGDAAVLRTQEQLDVLREAGVVDAGRPACSRSSAGSRRTSRASRCRRLPRRSGPGSSRRTRSCRGSATARASSIEGEGLGRR